MAASPTQEEPRLRGGFVTFSQAALEPRPRRRFSVYGGPACPHCGRSIEPDAMTPGPQSCPWCSRRFEAVPFSPPARPVRVTPIALAGSEGATACGVHERNASVANCGRCGIFMCDLCRIEADGHVLCPACFDRLAAEGALASARTTFRNFSGLSLLTALVGIFMWFFWVLTGPLAIYYAIRGMRQRKTQGDTGGRAECWTGLVLGALETVGGVFVIIGVVAALTEAA